MTTWVYDDERIKHLKEQGLFDPRFSNSTVYFDPLLYKAPYVTIMPSFGNTHTHTIPFTELQKTDKVEALQAEINHIKNRVTEIEECQDSQNKICTDVVKGLADIKNMVTKNRRISDDTADLIINKTVQLEEKVQYLVNEVNEQHIVFKHIKREYEHAARGKEPV